MDGETGTETHLEVQSVQYSKVDSLMDGLFDGTSMKITTDELELPPFAETSKNNAEQRFQDQ